MNTTCAHCGVKLDKSRIPSDLLCLSCEQFWWKNIKPFYEMIIVKCKIKK